MSTKNELFGQRFYMRNFEDEHKVNEDENKNIVDNEIHMNNNNDNEL